MSEVTPGTPAQNPNPAETSNLVDTLGILLPWEGSDTHIGALNVPLGDLNLLYVYMVEVSGDRSRILLSADPYEPEEGANLNDPAMIDEIEDYLLDDGSILLVAERKDAPRVGAYTVTHEILVPIQVLTLEVAVGEGAAQIGCGVLQNLCANTWPEYMATLLAANTPAGEPANGQAPAPVAAPTSPAAVPTPPSA